VMLIQLLVGSLVSAIAIMIHALATVGAIGVARAAARPMSAAAPDGCHGRHRTGANAGSYVRNRRVIAVLRPGRRRARHAVQY
jgi:hypothetical protein